MNDSVIIWDFLNVYIYVYIYIYVSIYISIKKRKEVHDFFLTGMYVYIWQ